MKKTKNTIVVDVDRLKYPNTGMYNFCLNLMTHLSAKQQFKFYFYKHKKTKIPNTLNSISIRFLDRFWLKPNKKFSLWHTTSQLSRRIPKKGIKLVYTLHDLNFLYTNKPEWKKRRELKKIQKNINRADYLTFISNFTLNEIKKHFNISNKKIKVIYNGVNVKQFPDFDTPRTKPQKDFLFTLGVIAPKKNLHSLFCLLDNNDFELVISGIIDDKEYFENLKMLIVEKKLEHRVHFTGSINEEEKYWYYSNCQAFVFPSISEGFGLPPIEAMRFGKPVFLSNLTSLPEIGGHVAYYFENFDASHMQKTLRDGILHYKSNQVIKSNQIIEWSNQFKWEVAANLYIEVYEELLNQ